MSGPTLKRLIDLDRKWRPNNRTPLEERLWRRVGVASSGCWEWTGVLGGGGYGRIRVNGASAPVHRVAYELIVGAIPDGLQLDHLCRNRSCVNPAHLEPVTPRVNTLRGLSRQAINAMKTHCSRNHPLSGDNLLVRGPNRTHPNGHRVCRECERMRWHRRQDERSR